MSLVQVDHGFFFTHFAAARFSTLNNKVHFFIILHIFEFGVLPLIKFILWFVFSKNFFLLLPQFKFP